MRIELGDLAVYPAHGVGRIEAVEKRTVADKSYDFFVMRILENDMKIMIPSQNIEEIGLRPLINKNQIKKIYDLLKSPPRAVSALNWNRRQREYMDKIKTGCLFDVASVLGELLNMRAEKELSFGERKLLDMVKMLLVKEVALASGKTEADIEQEVISFFPPPKVSS